MKTTTLTLVAAGALLFALAGDALAQRHGFGKGTGDGSGPQVDVSQTTIVRGEVAQFAAGLGQGMPQLVIRDGSGAEHTFVLGPFRYIKAQSFSAQAGDQVEVTAFLCASCESGLAAASVKNLSSNLTLVLRNPDGTPAWIGGQGAGSVRRRLGSGGAPGAGIGVGAAAAVGRRSGSGGCAGVGPDLARTTAYEGTVASFTGGPGEGMPVVELSTAAGDVAITLSPYRALAHAGISLVAGEELQVVAAPVELDGAEHWVALSVKHLGTGIEIALRDSATGRPLAGGRRAGSCARAAM
ncbi:MAG: hypothetical protein V1750_07100 [Acidobacteriota bacterium]